MKKLITILLALVMVITLTACGKNAAAQAVDDAIAEITSTDSVSQAVSTARDLYDALPEKYKNQVENLDLLTSAEALLKEISDFTVVCDTYDVERIIETGNSIIESANEIGVHMPELEQIEKIVAIMPDACYENTQLLKLEAVVSVQPQEIEQPSRQNGYIFHDYYFSSGSALNTALNEYCEYVNQFCTLIKQEQGQAYFETKDGVEVMISGIDFGSSYYLTVRVGDNT